MTDLEIMAEEGLMFAELVPDQCETHLPELVTVYHKEVRTRLQKAKDTVEVQDVKHWLAIQISIYLVNKLLPR